MTVVIDCNILVICLTSRSPYHNIYQSLINGKFNLAITVEIMLKYEEIIQHKYSVITANTFTALLNKLPNVLYIYPYYRWQLIESDGDDNKYCDCAVAGQADYIITEDRHFAVLKNIPFPSLNAISIDEFSAMLQ